ncbi:glycoside hydrolase family protein [Aeromonas rivipollensis]|uniref:glycoside hydrolase family protein n=1 Tax=Aeromonas rivipollensis TaxID=948519 RepID=UPI0030CAD4B5
MKFAFPILTAKGEEFKDVKALTALINGEKSGHYLLGNHNKWHGGIHISDQSAPWCKDKYPVRAMADGKVVAFRMMKDYLTSAYQEESLRYSNCFCLVEHEYCEINPETKAKNEFTFYSLYMHLLPWDQYQTAEKLVLKKGWNARNSVPHANPDADQQRADAALPRFTLPKDTELEMDSSVPSQKGNVGGKVYDFIKVIIKSPLSSAQIKEAEKAGVLVSEGSAVWIANSQDAVEVIKPNLPTWLFDQIEAELLTNMVGRADPVLNGPTGRLMAGDRSVSLPAGTKLQYDAHQLEFHWIGDKARKMARCNYVMPTMEGAPGSCGMAWVCVEDEFIKVNARTPSHLGELYVLPSSVAIAAGETIGYLGLVETPGSLIGGKKSKHQVHLEVFTQDPRLDDVLANKANTKGGASYAKVPAELVLHEKKTQDGKDLWVATGDKSLEELVESPKLEKDAAKQEWVSVSSGKYVKKEQVELLSQHDWLKIGFKKVDGSGSDGYLDPDAPSAFFTNLVNSFDTDGNGELSSEEIQAALQNSGNADQLHKLIVKHPSEWYEKSSASSYLWLDKLMAKIDLPDFDKLVDHEKQRIDKLEWMQSAVKLNLGKDIWHIYPIAVLRNSTNTKPIIFPLKVKPENDIGKKWENKCWSADERNNAATFSYPRNNGRRHAARDLYTNPFEEVIAVSNGEVLQVANFYCETYEVTILHRTNDGREFIMRYGELAPDRIKVSVGDFVMQGQSVGYTGKLLQRGIPLVKINGSVVFMLHVEIYSCQSGRDLKKPLTNRGVRPYQRREDLVDAIDILKEGYHNSFEGMERKSTVRRPAAEWKTSAQGIAFIKAWESVKIKNGKHVPYNDSEGYCTIGYGHLIEKGRCEDISIPSRFVHGLDEATALEIFSEDLSEFERAVARDVNIDLSQNEFDAFVSLLFNTGANFLLPIIGKAPKLRQNIASRNYEGIAKEFLDITNGGEKGLVKRRKAEHNMFLNNVYDSTH